MIAAVIFDLDGTLLDRRSSLVVYVHRQMKRCHRILARVSPHEYLAKLLELDGHGYGDRSTLFEELAAGFGLAAGSEEALREDFYLHFPDTCVPFPRLHQTLQDLAGRGLKLAIVTNGRCASQDAKIDGLGIRPYFDAVVVSEAEGLKKPDAEIYRRALKELHVHAGQTVFVGDNPELDVHAPRALGMKAVWVRDSFWPEPADADAEISRLDQLPGILDALGAGPA